MRPKRVLTTFASAVLTLVLAQCGGGSSTPTSPSPTPSPAPAPSPAPSPAPAPGSGSSLSIAPQTVQGQGQPQGTVTLASVAPSGGAVVQLTSDNTAVAKVPATVTVAAGARSATFTVDTATVSTSTTVRITSSYAGTSMTATLTVTPFSQSTTTGFVVRSKTRGTGACVADLDSQELDCVLDGSSSSGTISAYLWTYTMGSTTLRHTAAAPNAVSSPQGTGCSLYQQGTGGDDPNGDRYLKMEVTLQLRDSSGTLSDIVRQQVKVYPNKQCGFSY